MNIETITITQTETNIVNRVFTLTSLNDKHVTTDDPDRQILKIQLTEARPPQQIVVSGNDYIALGQWTDDSLTQYLITKFNLVLPPSTII